MFQKRVAAFFKEIRIVLLVAIPVQVPLVVCRVILKNARLPTRWRAPLVCVWNNVTGNGGNGSKGKGSDAKDAGHWDKDSC
jgi:hypothetical protein